MGDELSYVKSEVEQKLHWRPGTGTGRCGPLYLRLGWGPPGSHHPLGTVPARILAPQSVFWSHMDGRLALPTRVQSLERQGAVPREPPLLSSEPLSWIKCTRAGERLRGQLLRFPERRGVRGASGRMSWVGHSIAVGRGLGGLLSYHRLTQTAPSGPRGR